MFNRWDEIHIGHLHPFFDVHGARFAIQAQPIPVKQAIGQITVLLNLIDEVARSQRVHGVGVHFKDVVARHVLKDEHGFERASLNGVGDGLARASGLNANHKLCAFVRCDHEPRFSFATWEIF